MDMQPEPRSNTSYDEWCIPFTANRSFKRDRLLSRESRSHQARQGGIALRRRGYHLPRRDCLPTVYSATSTLSHIRRWKSPHEAGW